MFYIALINALPILAILIPNNTVLFLSIRQP